MKKRVLLVLCCAVLVGLMAPSVAQAHTSTRLYIAVDSQWEHYDRLPVLTGTLKTSRGSALKYKTVYLYYNGSKVGSKKTNSSGKVTFNLGTAPGDMQGSWNLRYSGSSTYAPVTSKKTPTKQHFHYLALFQVPLPEDIDADGVDENVIYVDLYLPGSSTYYISTSEDTVREVVGFGGDTNIYSGATAVGGGAFSVAEENFYTIRITCPDDLPVSTIIF